MGYVRLVNVISATAVVFFSFVFVIPFLCDFELENHTAIIVKWNVIVTIWNLYCIVYVTFVLLTYNTM